MGRKVGGCGDVCGGSRSDFDELSLPDVLLLLKRNEMGINIVHYIMVLLFILWTLATLIPGFNLYDGSGVSAYTHTGWWLLIQFFVLLFGESVTKFGLHYSQTEGVVEKGIVDGLRRMTYFMYLAGVAIVSHVVHVVLMGLETSACDSTLCSTPWAFWLSFALFALHPFLLGWLIYRVLVYRANVEAAVRSTRMPTTVLEGTKDMETGGGAPLRAPIGGRRAQVFHGPFRK